MQIILKEIERIKKYIANKEQNKININLSQEAHQRLFNADNLRDENSLDEAIFEYSQSISKFNILIQNKYLTDVQRLKTDLAFAYFGRGYAYFNKNEYDKTIADYNMAIELDNSLILAYYNRGLAYQYKKDYNKAIEDYKYVILKGRNGSFISDTCLWAYIGLGMTFLQTGDFDNALTNWDYAVNLVEHMDLTSQQHYHYVYTNRSKLLYFIGEYDKSLQDLNRYMQLNSNQSIIRDADIYNGVGAVYSRKKEYLNALNNYNMATKMEPENEIYRNNRILLYLQFDKFNDNINVINKDINQIFNIIINKNKDDIDFYVWKYFNEIYVGQHKDFLLNIFTIISLLQVDNININKYMGQTTFDKIFDKDSDDFRKLKINIASSMNDTNEGKIIFEYLTGNKHNDELHNKTNSVFISSFTENPSDAIGMWNSQYGDNCKGMSYTFSADKNIINSLVYVHNNTRIKENLGGILQYYRVAYYNPKRDAKYKFSVFKHDNETQTVKLQEGLSKEISDIFWTIQYNFGILSKDSANKEFLQKSLILLSHLVKSITYCQENEVRLINIVSDKSNKNIGHHKDTHIECFETEHKIDVKEVTLSPKLTQDPKYKDFYQYLFDSTVGVGKVKVNTSDHPYNL